MLRTVVLLTLLAAPSLWGCSGDASEEADAATTPETTGTAAGGDEAAQAPPAPVPEVLPEVVARVNGDDVSRVELERAIGAIEARAGGPVPPEQRDRIYRDILDQLIGYTLLVQEGEARRVSVPDAEVDARLAEIRAQFPSEADFERMLETREITLDQVREDARDDAVVERLIEAEMASRVSVDAADVDAFYRDNPDQFQQGESVRASHILIGTGDGADGAARDAAREKAADLLAQIRAGADFAALAREHSTDPGSAASGGDLGFFQQGQMVGPFNDAAFSLAPGAVSDLVETEFGFHIIKVAEKQPSRTIALEDVRPQVEQFLQQRERETQTDAFVGELRTKGTVQVLM